MSRKGPPRSFLTVAGVVMLLVSAACSPLGSAPLSTPTLPKGDAAQDLWSRLLDQEPYPYTTPLPPPKRTAVDGTYSKWDPREGTRGFCKRCMPYPAEGGRWLLSLDKGTYRILSTRSLNGWRSLGSFTVDGDQILLFNDPHCLDTVGAYAWGREEGPLVLKVVKDECANGWRGITFTNQPWAAGNAQRGE